jgi:histidinol-phosphatase (PHP family)
VLDYHVHLWPHPERADSLELRVERLAGYCSRALEAGVGEIAVTEHLFRFVQAKELIGPFWEEEGSSPTGERVGAYWDHHATADLDVYVESVLAAKAAGLPLVLGLEVDYYPGRMAEVASLLQGYPFDVLLGSVHWLGTFMFDVLEEPVQVAEWDRVGTDATWRRYTDAVVELAETATCDVLAHPDLVKLRGRRPPVELLSECEERIAAAAASSGMAAELSSAGWRKPVAEQYPSTSLLARLAALQVPLTTASDAHGSGLVADRAADLRALAAAAGYRELRAYRGRQGRDVPLELGTARAPAP